MVVKLLCSSGILVFKLLKYIPEISLLFALPEGHQTPLETYKLVLGVME